MSTIFDKIVVSENDHTNLLRSIMARHPKAAAVALSYLAERALSERDTARLEFKTQRAFPGPNGREIPDIFIEGVDFRCVIEAKVDPGLALTAGQMRGYSDCFRTFGESHLSFLVPLGWRHRASVERLRTVVRPGILIHLSSWGELVKRLDVLSLSLGDNVLREAVAFWKWRFELQPITSEERKVLAAWSEEKYSAMRKLERTLLQSRSLLDARGFETELEESDLYTFGFYIKRDRFYILWIGIWTKAPYPLSFGFASKESNWLRPAKLRVAAPSTTHEYHLWPLEPETWDDPEQLCSRIERFLQSYTPMETRNKPKRKFSQS